MHSIVKMLICVEIHVYKDILYGIIKLIARLILQLEYQENTHHACTVQAGHPSAAGIGQKQSCALGDFIMSRPICVYSCLAKGDAIQ